MWTLNAHDPSRTTPPSLFQRFVATPASLFLLVPFVLRNMPRQVATITRVVDALRAPADADGAAGPGTAAETETKTKIGFVGFCWGGRFAISLNHLFAASAACHPSLVRFPAELAGVTRPLALAVAATDPNFDRARAEEAARLLVARGVPESDVEVVVYEGVNHGWTTRADLADTVQRKARDDAVDQVVRWFEKHLAPDAPPPAREPSTAASAL